MSLESEKLGERFSRLSQRILDQLANGAKFVRTTPRMRLDWEELNGLSEEEENKLLCQLQNQGLLVVKKSGGVYNFSPKGSSRR